jgi:hypothetical protein
MMDEHRPLNEEEVYYLCKIILEDKRNISVGKTIMRYARTSEDKELFRAVHSRLLETGKYEATNEMDKYGLMRISYAPKKSWKERNWLFVEMIKYGTGIVMGIIIAAIIQTCNHNKPQDRSQQHREQIRDTSNKKLALQFFSSMQINQK